MRGVSLLLPVLLLLPLNSSAGSKHGNTWCRPHPRTPSHAYLNYIADMELGPRLGQQDHGSIQVHPPDDITLSPRRPQPRRTGPAPIPFRRPDRRQCLLPQSNVRFPRTSIFHLRGSNHRISFTVFGADRHREYATGDEESG